MIKSNNSTIYKTKGAKNYKIVVFEWIIINWKDLKYVYTKFCKTSYIWYKLIPTSIKINTFRSIFLSFV